jgi:hypothetical protein
MLGRVSIRTNAVATNVVLSRIVASIIVCASLALVFGMLFLADRGFVFSDEAFYLLNAEAPDSYFLSNTQFGYALQPFFATARGDVAEIRRVFILLLAGLGVAGGWVWKSKQGGSIEGKFAFVSTCGCAPFAYYYYFVLTPSYNLLILIAGLLLIVAFGMLYTRRSLVAISIVIAAAALISIMAKLTSAAALAAMVMLAVALLKSGDRSVTRSVLLIGAPTLIVLATAAIFLPVSRIEQQLSAYLEFFGPNSPMGRGVFDDFKSFLRSTRGVVHALGIIGIAVVTIIVARTAVPRVDKILTAGVGLFVFISTFVSFHSYAPETSGLDIGNFAAATSMLATFVRRDPRLGLSFLFMMGIPWAAGLGTGVYLPLSVSTFYGGLFAMIAAIGIYLAASKVPLLVQVGLALVLSFPFSAIKNGLDKPYRIFAPIMEQTELVTINSSGAELRLDPITTRFVRTLRDIALREDFCEGEPLIDMSGLTPGVAYVMGALPPGFAWLPAGYPFSDRFANFVLERVPHDVLDRSWLVVPVTAIAFPDTVRHLGLGLPLPLHRLVAKSLRSPQGDVFDLYAPLTRVPCAYLRRERSR